MLKRSGKTALQLLGGRRYCYVTVEGRHEKSPNDALARSLRARIKATGPVTVADFMRAVLVDPSAGYYTSSCRRGGGNLFGESGDFITSPELGQLFGEMVAVWMLNEWTKMGRPGPLQIAELGPGTGNLAHDILRVFDHFGCLRGASLHLIEASRVLSDVQAKHLCMQSQTISDKGSLAYKEGITHQGIPAKWYRHFRDVPEGFTLIIANEFFDALPIHKIQKTEKGYREVLIDIDLKDELTFRYVLAKGETPVTKLFVTPDETRDHFECSPDSLVLVKEVTKRLTEYGGACLIADYGHEGDGTDTFRSFKQHKLHDPLTDVGHADLTADVDFAALKTAIHEEGGVVTFGPVTQKQFLVGSGIEHRINALKRNADEAQTEALSYCFHMLTDDDKMGNRFKLLALLPAVLEDLLEKYPPAGFVPVVGDPVKC